jgi:anti-sigma factor RsiW
MRSAYRHARGKHTAAGSFLRPAHGQTLVSGKLPFSFNLPENLPSGTTLDGANLTYLGSQPTAQLLYSIGKHRVSVFVQARSDRAPSTKLPLERAGFHVATFTARDLEWIAVSDVDPTHLADLVGSLEQAQAGANQPVP